MSYTDLTQIQEKINTHKADLAANLVEKSVEADSTETFAVLIGKVKDIEQTGSGGSGESSLDWSTVTDMSWAFYQCPHMFSFITPTINCDMGQVTNWERAFLKVIISEETNNLFQEKNFKFNVISPYQFSGCTYLTNIEIPEGASPYSLDNTFNACSRLSLKNTAKQLENIATECKYTNTFYEVGLLASDEDNKIGDLVLLKATDMSNMFIKSGLISINSITNDYYKLNDAPEISGLFNSCTKLVEAGLVTVKQVGVSSSIFNGCTAIKKIHGFSFPLQKNNGDIVITPSYRLLGTTSFTKLEECLNIPVGYLRYGGTGIANLYGTSSEVKPLRRLTFCQGDEGYYSKAYAKNLPIQYCSFDREGMLEVFNTIPDASDVTVTSTITITGNPCVTDGTLTEEDIAIATAKGYVVTTA